MPDWLFSGHGLGPLREGSRESHYKPAGGAGLHPLGALLVVNQLPRPIEETAEPPLQIRHPRDVLQLHKLAHAGA